MRRLQDHLRSQLSAWGWMIVTDRPWAIFAAAARSGLSLDWTLESLTPPVGRQVIVEFRVEDFTYEGIWFEDPQRATLRVTHCTLRFRLAHHQQFPEILLNQHDCERDEGKQIRRVLEWFRNPQQPALWDDYVAGDWMPPEAAQWADPQRFESALSLEYGWETTTAVQEMLRLVLPKLSDRKRRLLACALGRAFPKEWLSEIDLATLHASELYAEEQIVKREVRRIAKHSRLDFLVRSSPAEAIDLMILQMRQRGVPNADSCIADTIREIAGNPFSSCKIRHSWLTGDVRQLCEAIEISQDYGVMPILGDALEDAGCDDRRLLDHCRRDARHSRGCVVLDLLCGKK
jgi:hypothetical protein